MDNAMDISFPQKFEIPLLKRTKNHWGIFVRKDLDLVSYLQAFWSNAEVTTLVSEKPLPSTNHIIKFFPHLCMPGVFQGPIFPFTK
jgi:hypothetical protein